MRNFDVPAPEIQLKSSSDLASHPFGTTGKYGGSLVGPGGSFGM